MARFNRSAVMMAMMMTVAPVAACATVAEMLSTASSGGDYQTPDTAALEQAEILFQRCFTDCDAQTAQQWQKLGFEVIKTELNDQPVIVIQEKSKRGRGFYLFRPHSSSTTVIQAPHSFKDMRTRQILLQLMQEGDFRAAAWNTVPRHYQRHGVRVDSDMAHLPSSYFLAFSRAFARRFSAGRLIQLHGFAQSKRRSASGADAAMVISSGSRDTTAAVLRMGSCLQRADFGAVRVYPRDIHELGATTNTIGRALRLLGHQGFVHIEMSAATRKALQYTPDQRNRLQGCLQ
ncbi:MAG: hypothetical protein R8K50_03545 [Mariprofundus sp.]